MEEGDFVRITFTGRIKGGEIFDTTDEELAEEEGIHSEDARYGPKTIVLGHDELIPGFERALLDAEIGEEEEVDVPPEEAFGERRDDAVVSLSKREYEKQFDEPPRRGQRVDLGGQEGVIVSTVGGHVRIDTNHPLAGQTLNFEYEVLEKIEEPDEKVRSVLEMATGIDAEKFDVDIDEGVVEVEAPEEARGNQMWMFSKPTIVERVFAGVGADEVRFVESFQGPPQPAGMGGMPDDVREEINEEVQERLEEEMDEEE